MPNRPETTHRRPHNWPDLLAGFIEARRSLPFVWGEQDCMTFACDGVVEMIGVDPIADKRGQWTTEAEGDAIVAEEGGFEAMMAARMAAAELPEVAPAFAQRGDIALVHYGNQETAGLIVGTTVAIPGATRVALISRRYIHRAWVV